LAMPPQMDLPIMLKIGQLVNAQDGDVLKYAEESGG